MAIAPLHFVFRSALLARVRYPSLPSDLLNYKLEATS